MTSRRSSTAACSSSCCDSSAASVPAGAELSRRRDALGLSRRSARRAARPEPADAARASSAACADASPSFVRTPSPRRRRSSRASAAWAASRPRTGRRAAPAELRARRSATRASAWRQSVETYTHVLLLHDNLRKSRGARRTPRQRPHAEGAKSRPLAITAREPPKDGQAARVRGGADKAGAVFVAAARGGMSLQLLQSRLEGRSVALERLRARRSARTLLPRRPPASRAVSVAQTAAARQWAEQQPAWARADRRRRARRARLARWLGASRGARARRTSPPAATSSPRRGGRSCSSALPASARIPKAGAVFEPRCAARCWR